MTGAYGVRPSLVPTPQLAILRYGNTFGGSAHPNHASLIPANRSFMVHKSILILSMCPHLIGLPRQSGYGTRLIPDGSITGAHVVVTPDYIQVTGTLAE